MMICLSGWQAEGQFMTKTADNVKKKLNWAQEKMYIIKMKRIFVKVNKVYSKH